MLKYWLFLFAAIVSEVTATSSLKASAGFSKLLPSVVVVVVVGYALSFYFLSLVLKAIPIGIAYAVWAGLGIVLLALVGWIVFGQALDTPAMIGIALILAGVIVMNVFSKTVVH